MKIDLVEVMSRTLEINSFEAIFNVPGYGGTEVYNSISKNRKIKTFINLNEEAAFSISYGVSSNGKRSALLIKSQGFTKALNAITSSMSTDSISANLIFVFDDSEGKSSDNILPTKNIVKSSEIPFQVLGKEPSKEIVLAIEKSEKLKLPVAIIVDCKKLKNVFQEKIEKAKTSKNKQARFTERLACPVLTKYQREKLSIKLRGNNPKISPPKIKDIRNVLPERLLEEFINYEHFMNIFKKFRPSFVSGDAGTSALFGFAPFHCVDTCTYMGGGPGMAMGAMIAGIKDVVCITGDFSFLAAGILGFNEALVHNIPLKLIIFNNGKAHATGGQELNPILIEGFCRTYSKSVTRIKLISKKELELEALLRSFLMKSSLSILVLDTDTR